MSSHIQLKGAMFAANTHDHTNQQLVDELVRDGDGGEDSGDDPASPARGRTPDPFDRSSSSDESSPTRAGKEARVKRRTMTQQRREAKLKTMQCKFCLVRAAACGCAPGRPRCAHRLRD